MQDDSVRSRLSRDCAAHQKLVQEVVSAYEAGALEDGVVLRTCALELHSVKGVASVLGLSAIVAAIGELCEQMMQPRAQVVGSGFFLEFDRWFTSLTACMTVCLEGDLDAVTARGLADSRAGLSRHLSACDLLPAPKVAADEPLLRASAGRRLLLIDDSATVRAALGARLTDMGFPVRTARSLEETASVLLEFDPEIVVTDVHMPDVEGDELCRRIKARMKHLVPVILYSSLPEDELRKRAIAAGADGFVCKAHGMEALVDRMDELLSDEILF